VSEPTAGRPKSIPPSRLLRVGGRPFSDVFSAWSRAELEVRFWSKVDKDGPVIRPELGECWIWTGALGDGYGILRRVGAHRVSYWMETGEEPGDRYVLHHCDNPPCVRPSHLHFGTHRKNMEEMAERGRAARNNLKISDDGARRLRERYVAGEKLSSLSLEYGISERQAGRIAAGATRGLAPVAVGWRTKGLKSSWVKVTPAQRAEIRRRRLDGEPAATLADEFGVAVGTVAAFAALPRKKRVRGKGHVTMRTIRKRLPADVIREIRSTYDAGGVTTRQIAREFGVERSIVSRIVGRITYADVV